MLTEYKHARTEQTEDRKAKLRKRDELRRNVQFAKHEIEKREKKFEGAVDALVDAESQLTAFRSVVAEKQRKLEIQEAYERDANEFIAVLKEYTALLTSLLDLKATGNSTKPRVTIDQDAIQSICDRIERHYFHPSNTLGSKNDSDTNIIMTIQSLVATGDCPEIFHVLSKLTRLSSESLFAQRGMGACGEETEGPVTSESAAVKAQLHKATRGHILGYTESKRFEQQTEQHLLQIENLLHAIEDEISDPAEAKKILDHLQAASDHEAYRAVLDTLESYMVDLEDKVRDANGKSFDLKEAQDQISNLTKEITRKHGLIASIMEANILSRNNILSVKSRNEQTSTTRICTHSTPLTTLFSTLSGHVSLETQGMNAVRFSDAAMASIRNDGHVVDSVSCAEEVLVELREALEMPKYLALSEMPNHVKQMKETLAFHREMQQRMSRTNQEQSQKVVDLVVDRTGCPPSLTFETSLFTLVDSIKAHSEQHTRDTDTLMTKIQTETMPDAELARKVSAQIAVVKERLGKRVSG
ncbi:hypothetical protein HDU98_001137 [Podochytrium sp. JEL0797]|nr:hypothetical protein HDU98_001137 [Podochytrium sp. JEL0797]